MTSIPGLYARAINTLVAQPSTLPLGELMTRINAIWERKGIKPKQHLSSPRPGAETVMEKRAHADRCYELPRELPDDMDLMIEVCRNVGLITRAALSTDNS